MQAGYAIPDMENRADILTKIIIGSSGAKRKAY